MCAKEFETTARKLPDSEDSLRQYLDTIGAIDRLSAEDEVELAKDIEAGLYARNLLDNGETGGRSIDDLQEIARLGGVASRQMIESNTRLVVSIANQHKENRSSMELLDLVQAGNVGLVAEAVPRFDYSRGNKFSTHAIHWIYQAIKAGIAWDDRTIRFPTHVHEKTPAIALASRELEQELGRPPSYDDIAGHVGGISAATVKAVLQVDNVSSLDVYISPDDPDGDMLKDRLTDGLADQDDALDSIVNDRKMRVIRDRVTRALTEEEYKFILAQQNGENLVEISERMGVGKHAAQDMQARIHSKLQHPSAAIGELWRSDLKWQQDAVCQSIGIELFFPRKGEPSIEQQQVCYGCDVQLQCLNYALGKGALTGVWGGTSKGERQRDALAERAKKARDTDNR